MGNKCCSKRQEPDAVCAGGKKNDFASGMSQQKYNNGSLDSRYTPDPNRQLKGGVDFIRHRQPTRKYFVHIMLYIK